MGRMDGNSVDVETADPHGQIARLVLEIQRLERANDQLQGENERLRVEVQHVGSVVGRGYRSVTVYADGTVEVDRSFDDDDEPMPSRRTL